MPGAVGVGHVVVDVDLQHRARAVPARPSASAAMTGSGAMLARTLFACTPTVHRSPGSAGDGSVRTR